PRRRPARLLERRVLRRGPGGGGLGLRPWRGCAFLRSAPRGRPLELIWFIQGRRSRGTAPPASPLPLGEGQGKGAAPRRRCLGEPYVLGVGAGPGGRAALLRSAPRGRRLECRPWASSSSVSTPAPRRSATRSSRTSAASCG